MLGRSESALRKSRAGRGIYGASRRPAFGGAPKRTSQAKGRGSGQGEGKGELGDAVLTGNGDVPSRRASPGGNPWGSICSGGVNPPCANPAQGAEFTAHRAAPPLAGPQREHHRAKELIQARVRVKVNSVTPSSLVTVMFSFRLPRMVFTIYSPRPTPSRSMERE